MIALIALTSGVYGQKTSSIEELRQDIQELKSALAKAEVNAQSLQTTEERIADFEGRLRVLEAGDNEIEVSGELDRLQGEVDDLRNRMSTLQWQETAGRSEELYWTSKQGNFSLGLRGFFQFRADMELAEKFDEMTAHGYGIPRSRLFFEGHAHSPRLRYRVMADIAQGENILRVARMQYWVGRNFSVEAGQYKIPQTRSFLTSSQNLAFPIRPTGVIQHGYGYGVGLGFRGSLGDGRIGFAGGLFNGTGPGVANDNVSVAPALRVDVAVLGARIPHSTGDYEGSSSPRVTIGGSVVYNAMAVPESIGGIQVNRDINGDGEIEDIGVFSASYDGVFRYQGFEVVAEVLYRRENWRNIFSANPALVTEVGARRKRNYWAGALGATYFVSPQKWLVGARAQHTRLAFLGLGGRDLTLPVSKRLFQIDGTVQYYFGNTRTLGVQYQYNNWNNGDEPEIAEDVGHRLIFEASLGF